MPLASLREEAVGAADIGSDVVVVSALRTLCTVPRSAGFSAVMEVILLFLSGNFAADDFFCV